MSNCTRKEERLWTHQQDENKIVLSKDKAGEDPVWEGGREESEKHKREGGQSRRGLLQHCSDLLHDQLQDRIFHPLSSAFETRGSLLSLGFCKD